MNRLFILAGAVFAALGVMLGAFGAHALKTRLDASQLQVFETGVRYQMYHALALIFTGILFEKINVPSMKFAGYFFIAGIIFFSGSLYLLSALTETGSSSQKFIGPITPIGGLFLIIGWILVVISFIKK